MASALVLLSFFAAKAGWDARNQRVKPGYTSEYLNTFTQPVANESTDKMTSFWLNRVKRNLMAFVPYYIPNSLIDPDNASFKLNFPEEDRRWVPGILVIAFMLVGLLSMKRLSLLLILYFLATFGSLMFYPPYYADIRYFIPLLPLMLAAFYYHYSGLCVSCCNTVFFLIAVLPVYFQENQQTGNKQRAKNKAYASVYVHSA